MFHLQQDLPKHQGLRRQLVSDLQDKGISDLNVLRALLKIPRHLFIDLTLEPLAYQDRALPIAAGQTISQPYTVAYQTSVLGVQPNEKVLEIGTGCGYQTAVLLEMGARVYTIERQKDLYQFAQQLFMTLKYFPVKQLHADGYQGIKQYAPYDKIIVTAAARKLPSELLKQLAIKGALIIPIGDQKQKFHLYTRTSETKFNKEILIDCKFVPMLKNIS